jgi:polyisoprenyl-phosphate glycosyltransferase
MRLFLDVPVAGWTSLMVVLLTVSGVQTLMMGILGEYLWRNLEESRRRPRFVIERTVENLPPCQERGEIPRISRAA